jgi:hypothetical protein
MPTALLASVGRQDFGGAAPLPLQHLNRDFFYMPCRGRVSKRAEAGLLRSTRERIDLRWDAGAVFLLTRDFFLIIMVLCMTRLLVEGAPY